jgi:hypothetical protein
VHQCTLPCNPELASGVQIAGDTSVEEQLFETCAARDEALQRCARLEGRLQDLFGAALLSERQHSVLQKGQGRTASRMRENELIVTIQTLQRALERKQRDAEHMVPSSRHMQVRGAVVLGLLLHLWTCSDMPSLDVRALHQMTFPTSQ